MKPEGPYPSQTHSPYSRRLRWLVMGYGFILLLWLPIEDNNDLVVSVFAVLLCVLGGLFLILKLRGSSIPVAVGYPLVGLAAGAGVIPAALFLMAFKSGLHGHGFPDFTPAQVIALLQRAPLFVAAGVFIALGIGIWAVRN